MNKPRMSPQRARERAVFRYRSALERGDFDTVVAILKMAEQDLVLMQMIDEMAELDEIPQPRPQPSTSSFFRQSKGITQLVNRRDFSPNGWPPKPNQDEEENDMNTTAYSGAIRRGKYGLNPNFLTVIAASVLLVLLGSVLFQWISNPIGSYGTLIEPSPTPVVAGCQVLNTADLPAESVRLAQADSELLKADKPDADLTALLGICALQTAYTPEADTSLQQALNQANLLPTLKGHTRSLFSAHFSPDGRYILTASWDHTARLWDAATLTEIREFKQSGLVMDAVFSPDGHYILTSGDGYDPNVRLWATDTGNLVWMFTGHTLEVVKVVFSPDGRYGLSASHDGTARLWDLTTGKEAKMFRLPGTYRGLQVQNAVFSPDGSRVITLNNDDNDEKGILQEWSIETSEPIRQFTGKTTLKSVWDIQFSPDGRYMVTDGDNGAALWDYKTGEEIQVFSEAGGGWTHGDATFSPDGRLVLLGINAPQNLGPKMLHLRDVETGQLLRVLSINTGGGSFSPDGRKIITALNNGNNYAVLYDTDYHDMIALACSKVTRDFTADERTQYGLNDTAPTCPQFAQGSELPAGMTPIPTQPIPVWTPLAPIPTAGS